MRKHTLKIFLILFIFSVSWSLYYYSFNYARAWHLFMDHDLSDGEILLTKNADMSKSKEYVYDLEYKYFNDYGIKIYFPGQKTKDNLGVEYSNYSGKFIVELIHKNKTLKKEVITRPQSVVGHPDIYDSSGNYLRHSDAIKYIQLDNFSLPYQGVYGDIKVKITILEQDPIYLENEVDIYLGITSI